MFLGAGGHVRRDLPRLLETLQQQHPQVRWSLQPAIGEAQAVIEAMARQAAGQEPSP
jgi:sirohydrochlorin cobaltochelatase